MSYARRHSTNVCPGNRVRYTLHALRKIQPDVRVVINSGFTEQETLKRFQNLAVIGVLHKPSPKEVLVAKIHKASN